jgi:hypothetical protein
MNDDSLNSLVKRWKKWADSANKSEDGWQSLFPEWRNLILKASGLMARTELTDQDLQDLEFSWFISEEDEDMADHVKKEVDTYW